MFGGREDPPASQPAGPRPGAKGGVPHEDQELAIADREGEIVDDVDFPEAFREMRELDSRHVPGAFLHRRAPYASPGGSTS